MSQLTAVPPLIADAWTNSRATLLASGRLIDEEFVRNGFSAVKALIEFKEKVYGIGTYNAYIEAQSGPEAFEQFRARNAEVMDKVRAARGAPLEERERVCESIQNCQIRPKISPYRLCAKQEEGRCSKHASPRSEKRSMKSKTLYVRFARSRGFLFALRTRLIFGRKFTMR